MQCPNCDGHLESKSFKKVKIDECNKCHGMWFEKNELRQAKDSSDEELKWIDFEIFAHKDNKYTKSNSERTCPLDSTILETLTYSDSKIKIDTCHKCQGVWLDNNEFEKIIKYLEGKVNSTSSGEYAKELAHEFKEILTGPEHIASEAKDFMSVLRLAEKRIEAEHSNLTFALSNIPIR